MTRIAFKMKLFPGCEAEYRRRHAAVWPELATLLKSVGVKEYSIFLDEETLLLFAYLQIEDPAGLDQLKARDIMWKWWDHMKDIMEVNPDTSPVTKPLQEVFYMP
ncbi:MAG: L-rhamnose mutarotase [Chitinophagaceae bacterium]|nr:L-rhamnose mutarotase [Chitinophagaceae bacterium]